VLAWSLLRKTSFLKKRSKKLLHIWSRDVATGGPNGSKVFWFFFSKKNRFLPSGQAAQKPARNYETIITPALIRSCCRNAALSRERRHEPNLAAVFEGVSQQSRIERGIGPPCPRRKPL
jgi:hypothetical protein